MLRELEAAFRLPGEIDRGLAFGAALGVLSVAVRDRGQVQVPSGDDDRAGWKPMTPHGFVLCGPRADDLADFAENILADLWGDSAASRVGAWPLIPSLEPGLILIPTCGMATVSASSAPRLASDVATWLCALQQRTQPRIVVRMDAQASRDWQGVVRDAGQERRFDLLEERLQRWTNVAALLAIGHAPERPIITRDLLMLAHEIAVVKHEVAWVLLQRAGTGVPVH